MQLEGEVGKVDFNLNDDQWVFQEVVCSFVISEFVFYVVCWDVEVFFLVDVICKVGELGFCGLYCDESVGGMGFFWLDFYLVFE